MRCDILACLIALEKELMNEHLMNELFVEKLYLTVVWNVLFLLCFTVCFTCNSNVGESEESGKQVLFKNTLVIHETQNYLFRNPVWNVTDLYRWALFKDISRAEVYRHCSFASQYVVYILNNTFFVAVGSVGHLKPFYSFSKIEWIHLTAGSDSLHPIQCLPWIWGFIFS